MKEQSRSTSKMKAKITKLIDEPNPTEKENEEKNNNWNKFKKVKMPIFNDDNPDA